MITPYTIPSGFFAGCTIYYDDSLPPDCASYERDGKKITWNTKTGEIVYSGNVKEYHEH